MQRDERLVGLGSDVMNVAAVSTRGRVALSSPGRQRTAERGSLLVDLCRAWLSIGAQSLAVNLRVDDPVSAKG